VLLVFTQPFGRHVPGDVIEVPDDVEIFDRSYLTEAPEGAELPAAEDQEAAPAAGPLYKKKD
jgi:hypothetical protein